MSSLAHVIPTHSVFQCKAIKALQETSKVVTFAFYQANLKNHLASRSSTAALKSWSCHLTSKQQRCCLLLQNGLVKQFLGTIWHFRNFQKLLRHCHQLSSNIRCEYKNKSKFYFSPTKNAQLFEIHN